MNGISNEAAAGDIDVNWDVTDDGPIALVMVPTEHPRYRQSPVIVECVKLVDGQLRLAGHTGPEAHQSYQPRGPVHRFVSFQPGKNRSVHAAVAESIPTVR